MTGLEYQVDQALRAIPHADDCGIIPGMPGGRVHECTCDRDQRVATRVAAAIEATADAASLAEHDGLFGDKYRTEWSSAALSALRGAA